MEGQDDDEVLPNELNVLVLTDNELGVYKSNFLCMVVFSCCFVTTKSDHKTRSCGRDCN